MTAEVLEAHLRLGERAVVQWSGAGRDHCTVVFAGLCSPTNRIANVSSVLYTTMCMWIQDHVGIIHGYERHRLVNYMVDTADYA